MPTKPQGRVSYGGLSSALAGGLMPTPMAAGDLGFYNTLQKSSETLGEIFKHLGEFEPGELESLAGPQWASDIRGIIESYGKRIRDLMQPYLGKKAEEIGSPAFEAYPGGYKWRGPNVEETLKLPQLEENFFIVRGTLDHILSGLKGFAKK